MNEGEKKPFVKKFPKEIEKIQNSIEKVKIKIEKETKLLDKKEENKEIALGTSKINYNDPRITVAWCKANEIPIEKVFPKTLRNKFVWAMNISSDWQF